MEDIEEIITEVTERAQAYLDSRGDETSSTATSDSVRRNINNLSQKTAVEDLQSARYQGDLDSVMDRFDRLKVTEEGEKIVNQKQQ